MDRKSTTGTFTASRKLLRELGRGRLGTTSVFVHDGPGGFLKLKIEKRLDARVASDPAYVAAFLAGARVAARLHHPNVAEVYEAFDDRVTIEHVEGVSLEAVMRVVPSEIPALLWIVAQALAGLDYAHAQAEALGARPVHGTLSARSILVTFEGAVKLVDFGLPAPPEGDAGTRPARAAAAPEGLVDRRSDVYAMGVVLDVIARGVSEAPEELEEIVQRATARDPDERHQTADELRAAIEAHLDDFGETIGAREVAELVKSAFAAQREASRASLAGRTTGPARRDKASAASKPSRTPVIVAVALAATCAAAFGAYRIRRVERAAAPSAEPVAARCTSNASCNGDGRAAAMCRASDGACVALEAPGCALLAEPNDAASADTIWIGAMFPRTGPDALTGRSNFRALDLARRDFVAVGGLPAIDASAPARRIAIVACDDAQEPQKRARHLVDDLHVPAVIGFARSQELIELATSMFIPRDVLAMSAINMSSLVTSIPHPAGSPRLVWRTMYTTTESALPIALFVRQVLEPRLRASLLGPQSPLRVAVVTQSNATGLAFSDALVSNLTYNGKPAIANGANFLHLLFPDAAGGHFDALAAALLGFRPHVVVYEGGDDFMRGVIEPLETRWSGPDATRPYYVTAGNLPQRAFVFIGSEASRRRRFFGLVPRASTNTNAEFVLHYNETFEDPVTVTSNPNSTYDAFYVVAYAMYVALASGEKTLTGAALARGVTKLLPPGDPVPVGPTHVFEALTKLRAGENIDLDGAVGSLDFDPRTGDAPSDQVVLCVDTDDDGRAVDTAESGIIYDARRKRLEGAIHCK